MKEKLKEALLEEQDKLPEDYEINKRVPIYGHKTSVARKLLDRMESGDSVTVLSLGMAQTMVREAETRERFATYKKEGESYRVWLI
jgi:hypothetical protein